MDELNEVDDELAFTTDDELELLRGSSLAIVVATIKFLGERNIPLGDWTTFLGSAFVGGWDTSEPWSPEEFIDAVLLNLGAFGAESTIAEYDDTSARARIENFPDLARLDGMGLENVRADVLFDLFAGVATACGLIWTWTRDGEAFWISATGTVAA
jgi:hypothetical protein